MASIDRWAAGHSYGPVLSQTDLYMLNTDLELHPILTRGAPGFSLVFDLCTGSTGGFNEQFADRDLPFTAKDEPATLPRVQEIIIITEHSPWCTTIRNENGVTLGDVCDRMYKDYTENLITEAEIASCSGRVQENIKRAAQINVQSAWPAQPQFYSPAPPTPGRYRRVDWLRDRHFFESVTKDDGYAVSRLGFRAPNIFVMKLAAF
ncbi:hypothetical protein EWM64_g6769 [Hericium alpestre]|uniref:DUF6699 domain-containing protein n=1 Tax=Hericium alpestre TaxID=135208 RepID=A0A4Y9ZT87_9AGAM|nr:hypothetical protein EWM64_g6769 [Hericium alpestre]